MRARARSVFALAAIVLSLAASSASLSLGCSGTSVGNPPGASVKLGVAAIVSPPSGSAQALDVGDGITIEEAWVALEEIGLRASGTCGGGSEDSGDYDVPGPLAAELVTGRLYPEAPVWERAPDERYCEFRTKIEELEEPLASAPEDLVGHAVYIRGARADGTPFTAQINVTNPVRIKPKKGPEIRLGDGLVGILLAFDLGTWLDASMLDAAQVTDGVIVINAESNKEIEKSLHKSIPASSRLFQDANRDGRLNEGDDEL